MNRVITTRISATRLILLGYLLFQLDNGEVEVVLNIRRALSSVDSGPKDLYDMNNHFLRVVVLLKESTGQSCNLITCLIFSFVINM